MRARNHWVIAAIVLSISCATLFSLPANGRVRPKPSLDWGCAECHEAEVEDVPAVPGLALLRSVHGTLECTDCHASIGALPHPDDLPRVDCSACHTVEEAAYTKHGRGVVGETEDLPGCADCHGSHEIVPSSS